MPSAPQLLKSSASSVPSKTIVWDQAPMATVADAGEFYNHSSSSSSSSSSSNFNKSRASEFVNVEEQANEGSFGGGAGGRRGGDSSVRMAETKAMLFESRSRPLTVRVESEPYSHDAIWAIEGKIGGSHSSRGPKGTGKPKQQRRPRTSHDILAARRGPLAVDLLRSRPSRPHSCLDRPMRLSAASAQSSRSRRSKSRKKGRKGKSGKTSQTQQPLPYTQPVAAKKKRTASKRTLYSGRHSKSFSPENEVEQKTQLDMGQQLAEGHPESADQMPTGQKPNKPERAQNAALSAYATPKQRLEAKRRRQQQQKQRRLHAQRIQTQEENQVNDIDTHSSGYVDEQGNATGSHSLSHQQSDIFDLMEQDQSGNVTSSRITNDYQDQQQSQCDNEEEGHEEEGGDFGRRAQGRRRKGAKLSSKSYTNRLIQARQRAVSAHLVLQKQRQAARRRRDLQAAAIAAKKAHNRKKKKKVQERLERQRDEERRQRMLLKQRLQRSRHGSDGKTQADAVGDDVDRGSRDDSENSEGSSDHVIEAVASPVAAVRDSRVRRSQKLARRHGQRRRRKGSKRRSHAKNPGTAASRFDHDDNSTFSGDDEIHDHKVNRDLAHFGPAGSDEKAFAFAETDRIVLTAPPSSSAFRCYIRITEELLTAAPQVPVAVPNASPGPAMPPFCPPIRQYLLVQCVYREPDCSQVVVRKRLPMLLARLLCVHSSTLSAIFDRWWSGPGHTCSRARLGENLLATSPVHPHHGNTAVHSNSKSGSRSQGTSSEENRTKIREAAALKASVTRQKMLRLQLGHIIAGALRLYQSPKFDRLMILNDLVGAVRVQAFSRMVIESQRFGYIRFCCIAIQCAVRSSNSRAMYRAKQVARAEYVARLVVAQAQVRCRVYSRRFQQTRSLTVQLQHMYRHHCYLRRNATCIQQSVRSWQARRELYRRRTAVWTASILSMQSLALALIAKIVAVEESQRQAEIVQRAKVFAARKTQALFRGKRQRQRFLHHRNQKIGAALLLQRFGRQVLSMRMLRALKREYEESKERASTRIQSVYRCYVRFRAHTTTKRAMMKLQSHFAKLKREREFKQMKAAAAMLQQATRKFFAEKDRIHRAVAARVMQKGLRRSLFVRKMQALFGSIGIPYPPFRAARQTVQQLPLWERKKKRPKKKTYQPQRKSKSRSSSEPVEVRKKYFLQRLRPALDTADPSKVLRKLSLTPFDKPFYFVKVSRKAGGGKQRQNLQSSETGNESAVEDVSILAFARQNGLPCTDSLEKMAAALEQDELEREAEEMAAMEEAYELEQRQAAVAATALEALKETPQTAALWEALPPERSVLGADGRSFNPRLGQESAPLLLDCVDKTRRVFIGHVWPFLCHRQELAYLTSLTARAQQYDSDVEAAVADVSIAAAELGSAAKQARTQTLDGRLLFTFHQDRSGYGRQRSCRSWMGDAWRLALETFAALHKAASLHHLRERCSLMVLPRHTASVYHLVEVQLQNAGKTSTTPPDAQLMSPAIATLLTCITKIQRWLRRTAPILAVRGLIRHIVRTARLAAVNGDGDGQMDMTGRGGSGDVVVRLIAEAARGKLGTSQSVENTPFTLLPLGLHDGSLLDHNRLSRTMAVYENLRLILGSDFLANAMQKVRAPIAEALGIHQHQSLSTSVGVPAPYAPLRFRQVVVAEQTANVLHRLARRVQRVVRGYLSAQAERWRKKCADPMFQASAATTIQRLVRGHIVRHAPAPFFANGSIVGSMVDCLFQQARTQVDSLAVRAEVVRAAVAEAVAMQTDEFAVETTVSKFVTFFLPEPLLLPLVPPPGGSFSNPKTGPHAIAAAAATEAFQAVEELKVGRMLRQIRAGIDEATASAEPKFLIDTMRSIVQQGGMQIPVVKAEMASAGQHAKTIMTALHAAQRQGQHKQ